MHEEPIQIEVIDDLARFKALRDEWNPLLQSSCADGIYLTYEYQITWWEHYGDRFKLRILVARRGQQLLGIAPLAIGPGNGLIRGRMRYLTFIGVLGDTAADFLDFIIAPGTEQEVVPKFYETIYEELGRQWDVLFLNLTPAQSPVLSRALPVISQFKGLAVTINSSPSPFLPLPDSWSELLSAKSKNFKKQFNNHWNRLHKNHTVEVLRPGVDLDFDEAFAVLVELNRKRWGKEGQAFRSKRFNRFHRELAERFDELGWLYFRVVKVDGEVAAARFDYVYNDKLWNVQGGWNPKLSHLSLGRILIGIQIKWCIEQGLKEYDFLAGDSGYKRSWATDSRDLVNVEVLNSSSWRALAYHEFRIVKNLLDPRRRPKPIQQDAVCHT
ncbi:MAG: CelD/BcsL family acetyltransferase involved in cellulose biosynthesis [Verrucomicrobiales bacterium]|jgi:CelD/BcsL family acetyltransferase involved in cellulose biosynthesis